MEVQVFADWSESRRTNLLPTRGMAPRGYRAQGKQLQKYPPAPGKATSYSIPTCTSASKVSSLQRSADAARRHHEGTADGAVCSPHEVGGNSAPPRWRATHSRRAHAVPRGRRALRGTLRVPAKCCSRGIPARMEETRCSICVHVATCSKHAPLWACVLSVRLSQLSFELRGPGATAQEHNLLLRLLQPLLSCGVDGHELVVLRVEFLAEPRRFRPGLVRAG